MRPEGREPLPDKAGESTLLSRSGGEKELRGGGAGKPTWLCVLQKDVQWSAYAVLPDLTEVDRFDLDIIFDDDFRSTNSLNAGDVFDIDFSIADKRIGIQKVEVIGIRKDKPLNHLENR